MFEVRISFYKEDSMSRNLAKTNSRELSPWSSFRDDVWDIFGRFAKDFETPAFGAFNNEFMPKIELKDEGKTYLISAEIPGMIENDINVTLKENNLIIEGEKKNETTKEDKGKGTYHSEFSYGRFYRAIPLGEDVNVENVNATYKNGVLKVVLEKLPEVQSKNRKIEIKH